MAPANLSSLKGFFPHVADNQRKSLRGLKFFLAARPGFEPGLGESKSPVLPLHHQAKEGRRKPPPHRGSRAEISPEFPRHTLHRNELSRHWPSLAFTWN